MPNLIDRALAMVGLERRQHTVDYINDLSAYYADGHSAHAVQTAAVEYGLGMIGRAFWYAMVEPALPVLTPNVMGMLGRQTVGTGNSVWRITAGGAGLRLTPVSAWEISGGVEEDTWAYRMELERPSGDAFVRLSRYEGVVHVRYMPRPTAPWAGVSPLTAAGLTAQQLGYIERSLRDDVELPTGAIMPLPDGVNQTVVTKAGTVLSSGRGATSLLETTAAGFGQGMHAAPKQDWMQRRFGPEPPATAIDLRESSALWILGRPGSPCHAAYQRRGSAARSLQALLHRNDRAAGEANRLRAVREVRTDHNHHVPRGRQVGHCSQGQGIQLADTGQGEVVGRCEGRGLPAAEHGACSGAYACGACRFAQRSQRASPCWCCLEQRRRRVVKRIRRWVCKHQPGEVHDTEPVCSTCRGEMGLRPISYLRP